MTAQLDDTPAVGPGAAWPQPRIETELAVLLGRRLAEQDFLGRDGDVFREVLGGLVRGRGKRLRPVFVYWGYRAAGGAPAGAGADAALRVGCAVEFLHAGALICDDLMDGSATRRGAPAAHVALAEERVRQGRRADAASFGRAAALTLGLQAITWADAAICDAGLPPARLGDVLRLFTTLRAEVIGGQYLDLVQAGRWLDRPESSPAQQRTALRIARYKSAAYTVQRPLQLGAAVARGGGDGFLSGYGLPLGEAFQLRDDVLGVFGDPAVTGKPAGEDIRAGKQTLLLVLGRQRATPAGRRLIDSAASQPAASAAEIERVRDVLVRCGALDAVERRIADLASQAQAALDPAGELPADARAALASLAGQVTERGR